MVVRGKRRCRSCKNRNDGDFQVAFHSVCSRICEVCALCGQNDQQRRIDYFDDVDFDGKIFHEIMKIVSFRVIVTSADHCTVHSYDINQDFFFFDTRRICTGMY